MSEFIEIRTSKFVVVIMEECRELSILSQFLYFNGYSLCSEHRKHRMIFEQLLSSNAPKRNLLFMLSQLTLLF